MADIHIRLNVRASFSITLGVGTDQAVGNPCSRSPLTESIALRKAVAENLDNLIEAAGGIRDFIDSIEIAEVTDDSDRTIVRGTNG